ncbi:MAG: HAD family phosphatase [Phycisphaerales bacterium]|nr:HAD family phosphatase [Planctomycetota bacterium]
MRGIVFDFDGVIVDTEPLHERALLECARGRGLEFTHEQYMNRLIGLSDRECLPVLYGLAGRELSEPEHASFLAEKKSRVQEMIVGGQAKPFPGTLRLVRESAGRVPIAVCSGAIRHEIELVLSMLGIADHFVAIVSADDVVRSKPDPQGYKMAAEALRLLPQDCVAIEDTPTGCRAALGAGLRVIATGHSLPRAAFPAGVASFVGSTEEITLESILAGIQ